MAIKFHYEGGFKLQTESDYVYWLNRVITSEERKLISLDYVFCDDEYLAKLNVDFLGHDTYTDIITFDYSEAGNIQGDIFISYERVEENAETLGVAFEEELRRVMVHGILHLVGYDDKTEEQRSLMRNKEDQKINMFHVEH